MRILCSALLVLITAHATSAQVYYVENYHGFDVGWSMEGGTITTDGFVGTIDETSDISSLFTDWSIAFTSPQGSFGFTPANSEFMALDSNNVGSDPVVDVTEQDINVLFDPFSVDLALTSAAGHSILWDGPRYSQGFGNLVAVLGSVELHDGTSSSVTSFGSCFVGDPGCPDAPDDLLVASVPEPTAGVSLVAWIVAVFYQTRRRFLSKAA